MTPQPASSKWPTRSRRGKYDPSLPLAFRIADVFGLPIEQIFLRD